MFFISFTTISYLYRNDNITSSQYLSLLLNESYGDNLYTNIVEIISNNLNPLKLIDIEVENKKFDLSNRINITNPIIYIYNKDQNLSYKNEYNMIPTVSLCEELNNINVSCIFENNDIDLFLSNNNISKDEALDLFKRDKIENYKSLEYLIELGRSERENSIKYDNNSYGKINLYANGNNISFVTELNNLLNEKVPNISKIYFDLEYNTSLMIDIGGKNNSMSEIIRSIKVLSSCLKEEIYG